MGIVKVWRCTPVGQWEVTSEWLGKQVNEITSGLPSGVYTTLRTYSRTKTIWLERHFSRLVESFRILGGELDLDAFHLREKLRIAISHSVFPEIRIRIQVPLNQDVPQLFLVLENLPSPDPTNYLCGVEVTTRLMHRNLAGAKVTDFIQSAQLIRIEQDPNINEVIMIGEDGTFLEGLSSNFYAVEQGRVWTADQGVLAGITRSLILEIISEKKIPVTFSGYPAGRVLHLEEAFISSTSRGVLPVRKMDGELIRSGNPGPLTEAIRSFFEEKVIHLLETI